jgi:Uma2 family endonuclease
MNAAAQVLAGRLARLLSNYGIGRHLGEAFVGVPLKPLKPGTRPWRPSVSFVSAARWPLERPIPVSETWDVVPDLCAEVVEPDDLANDVMNKVLDHLAAGVRLVWVVYPGTAQVHVQDASPYGRVLSRADTLDGGPVLPGFALPLAELLWEPEPAASESDE